MIESLLQINDILFWILSSGGMEERTHSMSNLTFGNYPFQAWEAAYRRNKDQILLSAHGWGVGQVARNIPARLRALRVQVWHQFLSTTLIHSIVHSTKAWKLKLWKPANSQDNHVRMRDYYFYTKWIKDLYQILRVIHHIGTKMTVVIITRARGPGP